MTKLIAHRGLLDGPDKEKENHPDQILQALSLGYGCEIDLWLVNNQLYLGHDNAQYHIGDGFLKKPDLWIHAKNLDALHWLTTTDLNYFWHEEDDFTLTSHGYIWTYPGKPLTDKSVSVMPEWNSPSLREVNFNCYAVCSDYITTLQKYVVKTPQNQGLT